METQRGLTKRQLKLLLDYIFEKEDIVLFSLGLDSILSTYGDEYEIFEWEEGSTPPKPQIKFANRYRKQFFNEKLNL